MAYCNIMQILLNTTDKTVFSESILLNGKPHNYSLSDLEQSNTSQKCLNCDSELNIIKKSTHYKIQQAGAELGQAQPNWKWGLVRPSEILGSNTLVELVNLKSIYQYY